MRKKLGDQSGERKRFRATFVRFGKKNSYTGFSEETLLLQNVTDTETNERLTDHIWFSRTKGFDQLVLRPGMQLEFDARVKEYKKGYVNKKYGIDHSSTDFKLSHPTNIKIVSQVI